MRPDVRQQSDNNENNTAIIDVFFFIALSLAFLGYLYNGCYFCGRHVSSKSQQQQQVKYTNYGNSIKSKREQPKYHLWSVRSVATFSSGRFFRPHLWSSANQCGLKFLRCGTLRTINGDCEISSWIFTVSHNNRSHKDHWLTRLSLYTSWLRLRQIVLRSFIQQCKH